MPSPPAAPAFDALVVGAGFGGLGAALSLAERGARVCLCETLRYPGGCASTFAKGGARFDAGATLVSGLDPSQLFGRWLSRYAPDVTIDWIDPLVTLRAPGLTLPIGRDRDALLARFAELPGAPLDELRAFFAHQRTIAAALWALFDDPALLPPFDLRALARHAGRALRYAPVLGAMGRSLFDVMEAHGVASFEPLRLYADALCQITVQCAARDAEAPFALAAMDYYYRGTGHVRGGVGALADALLGACRANGVDVRLATRVTALRRDADGTWTADTRRGPVRARHVVANVLPSALANMVAPDTREAADVARLAPLTDRIDDAWGAAMLYLVARAPEGARPEAHHLQLVDDATLALHEGNHVFVSISGADEGRAPAGHRAITTSTHVPLSALRDEARAATYVAEVQAAMRRTIAARAPEWHAGIVSTLPASPRTFARFVGRPRGAVGGVPRFKGLAAYGDIGPARAAEGLWLVGDSVFPGQSALATAIGGARTAAAIGG